MIRVRSAGISVLAALMLAAAATGNASATLPEWGTCEGVASGGKYADSSCTVKDGTAGKYEWYTGAKAGGGFGIEKYNITLNAKPLLLHMNALLGTVECALHGSGKLKGTKEVTEVFLTFKECTGGWEGVYPTPTTEKLKGELGYIKPGVVGLSLTPAVKGGFFINQTESPRIVWGVEPSGTDGDSVIGTIRPTDEATSMFELSYSTNEKSENLPTHFEGKPTDVLQCAVRTETEGIGPWYTCGFESTFTVTIEASGHQIELKD